MTVNRTALVLGATGGIGGSIASALLRQGWRVRGMARTPPQPGANVPGHVEWIRGDAMRRDDVVQAAQGVSVIVHAVNPPGYRNWEQLVLPMIDNTIAAARAAGQARIVLPGTIYNYDPAVTPLVAAESPQTATSRKGRIRVEEQRLEEAAGDVPSLILRAGDFFGPGARSSWFSDAMVSSGRPLRRIINPARGAGHSWAYLPDLARAFARVLEEPARLGPFERLQFAGHCDVDGAQMVAAIRQAAGRQLRVYPFPWWMMQMAAPFGGFPREAAEIAPYWRHPLRLDNAGLVALIGPEPHTPLQDAVQAALLDLDRVEGTGDRLARIPAR